MAERETGQELDDVLHQRTQEIWNKNAQFWDQQMGEGNAFQRVLVGPATERLLDLCADEEVLEIACGNGIFARRMAELGARVVASDFSQQFLEIAQRRAAKYAQKMEFCLIDATKEEQIVALGEQRFDAAVCNMGLMDMTSIEPLLQGLKRVLKPSGRFVFSIMHPCFNNSGRLGVEEEDRDGTIITQYYVKVAQYLGPTHGRGLGMIGQPEPQYYFYRPLNVLFNACFQAGFVLDGLEEPAFTAENSSPRPLSWANYREIPPVLVARLRVR